jgi:hypothetical protein
MGRGENAGRKPSATPALITDRIDEPGAYSVEEFCRAHKFSVQAFYKYPELMPDCFFIGSRRLISREARARWIAAREAEARKKQPPINKSRSAAEQRTGR